MTADEESTLRAENAALREQVQTLLARVQELEGRLAKDRHNRSRPPSSDGLRRKPKSQREKSGKESGKESGKQRGKQRGAPPGHAGHRVSLVATPDLVPT